jgi:WD40 repeat protein
MAIAFDPQGARLASAGNDRTIKLWDSATGHDILTLREMPAVAGNLGFSADGRRLAAGLTQPDQVGFPVLLWNGGALSSESFIERQALAVLRFLSESSKPSRESIGSRLRADRTISDEVRKRALQLLGQ